LAVFGSGRQTAGEGAGGGAGRGQRAADFGRAQPDRDGDGREGGGDLLLVQQAAGDVAVDLERAPVQRAVASAGPRLLEDGQLGG